MGEISARPDLPPELLRGGDLAGRTARGAAVTLAGDVFVKGLAIVAIFAVARLLDAASYGVVLLAIAVAGFADVLSNPALTATLLREPRLERRTVDVAWTASVVRGLLLAAVFWCLAPLLASCWPHAQAELEGWFRLLSFSFALQGLANLHAVQLRRDLRYLPAFLLDSVSPVASSVFVIGALALSPEPVWLIAAHLVGPAAGALLSLLCVRPLPRFAFDRGELLRLWRFGAPLLCNGVMGYVLLAGDAVFVEYLAGAAALGVYGMSMRWSLLGPKFLAQGLQNVLLPAYVLMRDDHARTRHAVASALSTLTAVCAVLSGLFLAFADELFAFLGGGTWNGAGAVARALVPFALAYAINACLTPVFLAHGKPQWLTRVIAAQVVCFFPAMYLGHVLLGLPGLALGVSLVAVGVCAALLALTRALIGMPLQLLAAALLPPLGAAGLATAAGWLAAQQLTGATPRLFAGAAVTVVCFLAAWECVCRRVNARELRSRSLRELAGMLWR